MQRVTLKEEINVSRLCFGTANLGRLDSKHATLRMLEAAYEAGLTHFDTARLYGHGTMERTVGNFIRGKRDKVTVTTKFGLNPLLRSGKLLPLLNAAKFIAKKIPALRRRAVRMAQANIAPSGGREQYSRSRAERSLYESLRELNTDYIDIYLLHEANPALDVSDDLLSFLQNRKEAGIIRAFGTGSAYQTIRSAGASTLAMQDVLQFESDVTSPNVRVLGEQEGYSIITHGVYRSLKLLVEAAKRQPEIVSRHAKILGAEVTKPQNLSRWLLGHALRENINGSVLISTVRPSRLLENVRSAEVMPSDDELTAFENYVHEVMGVA